MTIYEIIVKMTAGEVAGWGLIVLIILFSLIQIAPVKLNPWDKVFGWIGKKVNGAVEKRIGVVEKQVRDMWINSHRQSILTFARECRADIEHDSEEWANILNQCEDYELYCETNKVANGVVKSNITYIRNLYQELSRDHRL